ncbi:MAG: phosphomannose isomerase type II C-terminal cupin domain [SAR324 cluster bacterium]|nr:phosphomannose isomerase type II C-terminal cupin domain [SAR324 cluster bacterium]
MSQLETDHRPWGYYEVLSDESDHKVKRIVVYPDKRLSLQRHQKRQEHWFIVSGTATVTVGESEILLKAGQSVNIPMGSAHRMTNSGIENMVFIEIQTGSYFGEDDIERLQDDYGRN